MSKNFLIPSCIAAMVLSGGLAAFSALQFTNGTSSDRYYATQASSLQGAALNTITLSMRAATDASYIGQMQQSATQVNDAIGNLRRGSSNAGVASLPNMGIVSLDSFDTAWAKVAGAVQQLAASRGNNSIFERQAAETSQIASTLITESTDAIDRIKNSPAVNDRIKQALTKAKSSLGDGIELLASTSTPNSDSLNLAKDASQAYVSVLGQIGSAMPRDNTLIEPLLKSYRTAQALNRATIRASEAASGTVDNAPHARTIWAERENLDAALNGLQHAINSLPRSRVVTPMLHLGSVGLALLVMLGSVVLVIREASTRTRLAESLNNNIQTSQKERSQELRVLTDEIEAVGQGDLTAGFTEGYGSTDEIASTLNTVFPQLSTIIKDVQQTIVSLSAAAEQTLSMAKNINRNRGEQTGAIQHIASLVAELRTFTQQLDDVIGRTRDTSQVVSTQINAGTNAVQEVHEGVVKLSQSNMNIMHHAKAMTENIQSLEQFVDVVRRVANQAATVAYNAHLAADAISDDGLARRIRVSADAMGSLTQSANEASEQIATNLKGINDAAKDTQYVLDESQGDIKQLTNLSSNALKAMNAISQQTAQLVDGIVSVASQTSDLNKRSEQVADTMESIHHYASEHSAASEETASAISNLNTEAQRVGETLSHFKV
ncbi:methyl-accepting chemotaxis protein [Pseudomonas tritici]|uniref:methyl-accepting chemotaxis protein n=1 Tax=Pseudomonas tritici TaxID=2745518 RepID=UPI00387ABA2C